jgi:hypothetical protein
MENECDLEQVTSRAGAHLPHVECEMQRRMLSVKPDRNGWVLLDEDQPVEWFRTRYGAVAIGEVKAYAMFLFGGIPSALTIFVDATTSITEVQYG